VTLPIFEHQYQPDVLADFRVRTTLWIAVSGLIFLAPFGVANMFLGRFVLGFGATVIVMVLALLARLSYKGHLSNASLLLFPPVVGFLVLSIQEQGVIGVMWAYPGIVCFYFVFRERWAWVANFVIIVLVVPMSAATLEKAVALRAMVTLIVVSVFSIFAVRVISMQQSRLETMAVTDSLTGLLNRSLLTPALEQASANFRRTEEPTTLLAIDIDLFKNINDTFGHRTGDEVLIGVAELLTGRLRSSDMLFRTGGEEFAVLLPNTAAEPGHHVAQLLRSAIAGENLLDSHPVTISVGVAIVQAEGSVESWLARADRCLYDAKHAGRNRVVADQPVLPVTSMGSPQNPVRPPHEKSDLR